MNIAVHDLSRVRVAAETARFIFSTRHMSEPHYVFQLVRANIESRFSEQILASGDVRARSRHVERAARQCENVVLKRFDFEQTQIVRDAVVEVKRSARDYQYFWLGGPERHRTGGNWNSIKCVHQSPHNELTFRPRAEKRYRIILFFSASVKALTKLLF